MTSVVSSSVPFIDLPHVTKAQGTVTLPGSKSISNRVLLLAALAEGTTTLHGVLESDDTRVMLEGLRQLGVPLEVDLAQRSAQITGIGAQIRARGFPQQTADIYLGNAGTAFRPLTAVLACLPGNYYLHGVTRMHERPIADLVTALQEAGAQIEYLQNPGYPPLRIQTAAQGWQHRLQVPGNVSSQFLTALLLAAPLLTAQQALEISVVGELISQPYIAITLDLMRRFGVEVENHDWKKFIVPAQAFYQSPETFWIEGDASSASYFFALGLLGQGPITVQGVGHDSIQGDMQFAHWLTTLGADIEWHPNQLTIQRAHSLREKPLPAFRLDALLIPDAAMTAAVLALFADGPCTIENIASWRVKETDRIAAMQTELRRLGAEVHSTADSITIHPIAPKDWRSAAIATYDDHRMAMCFSLAAFGPSAIRVLDPDCVAKTFPEYFAEYAALVHTVPPVITIDGPTASGKGTLAARVAERLGFQVLDSGALYRLTALACTQQGIAQDAESDIALIAAHLKVRFEDQRIWLNGEEVTEAIRAEAIGNMASSIAAYPSVRAALLERQIAFQQPPGLVADGRDMGTVVFPHAFLKIFVEASAEVRAERRYRQLSDRGLKADYSAILADLQARDRRDRERTVAPLAPASDAYVLDTSHLSIEDAVEHILSCYNKKLLMQPH